ncbi:MAG: hypothetical protein AAFU55_06470 [Pseudomonadota bacterium]
MNEAAPPKPVRIEGTTFRLEVPDGIVKRDALFYVFSNGGPNVPLEVQFLDDYVHKRFSPRTEGWGYDSPYRVWTDVAADIGEWKLEILTFPPEAFAPFYADVSVRGDRLGWLSDIHAGSMEMVRPAVRAIIEELDPGMNYFFPMKIFNRDTGEVVSDEYSYWLPRRRMWFRPKDRPTGERRLGMPFEGPFSSDAEAWELIHNHALRRFVGEFPFWGLDWELTAPAMSASAYRHLKAEKFVGLQEITSTGVYDRDFNQNIGCF